MIYTLDKMSYKGWTFETSHKEVALEQLSDFICNECAEECPTYVEYIKIPNIDTYNYPERYKDLVDVAIGELLGTSCGAEFDYEEKEEENV
jgi:hypothetical protein